jgi:hypothetical protein
MARVMREYHRKWRYRHPASQDFFDTVNQVTGQDFAWFFDQFVKGVESLDYEIAEIKNDEEAPYESEVTVRRAGAAWFPVEMLFSLENGVRISAKPVNIRGDVIDYRLTNSKDGSQWADSWAINDRWKRFKFTAGSRLISAEIDPERKVLLDANLTNNGKTASRGIGGAIRWSSAAMYWTQALMSFLGFLS